MKFTWHAAYASGIKSLHSTTRCAALLHSSSPLLELPLGITPSGFIPLGDSPLAFSVYFIIFFKGG